MADHEAIEQLAGALVDELRSASKAVSTAESCTGGWIAKAITDIAGSSDVFHYGIVSYSNGAKESLLGVQNQTLEDHGAVSEAVVIEMAEGALNLSGADIGIAVSNIGDRLGDPATCYRRLPIFVINTRRSDSSSLVKGISVISFERRQHR